MTKNTGPAQVPSRRMPKAERHTQLLGTALQIVREEGADRLTLGHLAERAAVSKPVVYDHFATRSALLIELYRWIDTERVKAFAEGLAAQATNLPETVQILASAYILCASDMTDEFHAVAAAMAGSEEKAAVFQELLDNCVQMFVSILTPHVQKPLSELRHCCTGLVGAGEALSVAVVRGRLTQAQATAALAALISGVAPAEG